MHKINPVRMDVLNTVAMKIYEIYNTDENIGPAPAGACIFSDAISCGTISCARLVF